MTRQLVSVLLDARQLIADPKYWVKGVAREDLACGTCFCAVGALDAAAIGLVRGPDGSVPRTSSVSVWAPAFSKAQRLAGELKRRLRAMTPRCYHNIPEFNDAADTTHADVLALFDRAIWAQDPAAAQAARIPHPDNVNVNVNVIVGGSGA